MNIDPENFPQFYTNPSLREKAVVNDASNDFPESNVSAIFIDSREVLLKTQDKAQKQISDLQERIAFLEAQLEQERIAQMEAIKAIVQEAVIPLRDENAQLHSTVAILDEKVTLWLAEREAKRQSIEERYLNQVAEINSLSTMTEWQKSKALIYVKDMRDERLKLIETTTL